MKVVQVILLALHLLGIVVLLVGLLAQVRRPDKRVTAPMRDGIGLTFVAGLLLVGVLEIRDEDVDSTQVTTMFAIGLVILVLVMANLRKPTIPDWLWWLVLALTVGDVVVALAL
jgi:peptidoglycan/LPS O-acetylase OafA/YrhL